ncbi:MAG: hypothetical protein KF782_24930 [Labilithrix sp.]|nr:hypothetical protein [Labilithrix sp.]
MPSPRSSVALALALAALLFAGDASAQACCVGASGLTPGWLANHEQWLVGAQLRVAQTHGTYPTRGAFYEPAVGRDARIEPSLFATARVASRGQVSFFAPLVTTRRRAGDKVETRTAPGDVTLVGRYDFIRPGEARLPGIALLGGIVAPTGIPPDRGTGILSADVTGVGAWEANAGVSIEQVYGRVVLHGTALVGLRAPREVLGLTQRLGPRALYLLAGGYVFDGDVAVLGTVTHTSDGDATVGGEVAPGTGFRATQAALLLVVPISDTVRIRTSAFTDVPPLGNNRQALGGTSISLLKSWY